MMSASPLAAAVKEKVSNDVLRLKKEKGITPKLVALLIGSDPVSRTYVDLKKTDCAEVGILSEVRDLSSDQFSSLDVIDALKELNDDPIVHAVIPQMPFSGKVAEEKVFSTLSPNKDVDGLTPYSLGKLVRSSTTSKVRCSPVPPKDPRFSASIIRCPSRALK